VVSQAVVLELETPTGPGRARLEPVAEPWAALVLGHGSGGGIDSPDLLAAGAAAVAAGVSVALVEQPYRVAGRRAAPRAPALDEAWLSIVLALQAGPLAGLPLITGGRSAGARVACRTAAASAAIAVLCLAFPLHPPGNPEKSRLPELDEVQVPVLILQGKRDPFGRPPAAPGRELVIVPGTHTLRAKGPIETAIAAWLSQLRS
jgi:predicted alpha/beta-hydrolase family hydrolase